MPKLVLTATVKQKRDLIEAVRAENSLYNPKTAKLKPKRGVWGQVAARCGVKRGLMAKLMWKNIHDAYVAYRKNPDKHRNDSNSVLFEHMKFLDPYLEINVRKHHPTPESRNIKTETNEVISEVLSSNLNDTTTSREFTTIQYWNDSDDISKSSQFKELETSATLHPTSQACSELCSGSDMESYEDILLPDAVTNGTSGNSLKMFFDAMFASTSQMPQVFQRIVKSKIFAAVLEAEEEAEKLKSSAVATSCIE